MLAYRIVKVVFSIALVVFLVEWLIEDWPFWYFAGTLFLYLAIIGFGSYNIKLNFFTKALCQGSADQPKIALTFDDGPSAEYTPEILDILRKYNAKATFFCIGKHIEENRALLSRIHSEGHAIGNHSFSHSYVFDFFSRKKVTAELQQTIDLIQEVTGKTTNLFRPPYGVTNPQIAKAADMLNLSVIGWNIRSYDTMNKPVEVVVNNVLKKLKNGSVVLLHDNRKHTPKILEGILHHASKQNLKCVDVCELFGLTCYETKI